MNFTSIFTVLSIMLGTIVVAFLVILRVLLSIRDRISDIDKRQMAESLKPKF